MILVDSSVWIDHFRNGNKALLDLLQKEEVCIAGIILLEIVPFLSGKEGATIVRDLERIPRLRYEIGEGDWDRYIRDQQKFIKKGITGIGISDLLILETAQQYGVALYSLDRMMKRAAKFFGVQLGSSQ